MGKRYIDCSARELAVYQKKELLQSIADSEGRVVAKIQKNSCCASLIAKIDIT